MRGRFLSTNLANRGEGDDRFCPPIYFSRKERVCQVKSGVIRYWGNEFAVCHAPYWVDVWDGMVVFSNGQCWETKEINTGIDIPPDGDWYTIALQVCPADSGGWKVEYRLLPGLSYDDDYDKVVLAQARWERGYIDCQDRRKFVYLLEGRKMI